MSEKSPLPLFWIGAASAAALGAWFAWRRWGGTRLVHHRERAEGVDVRLQAFLDWWSVAGPFAVTIPDNGGVRTDEAEQGRLYASGVTRARTLEETPHGRGGAIDLYPVLALDAEGRPAAIDLHDRAKFAQIGAAAKAFGLSWGGDFAGFYDGPHVEVVQWRALPYPPRRIT